MRRLQIPQMNCDACVSRITRLIKAADADAALEFDLAAREVKVATALSLTDLVTLLDEGGYEAALSLKDNE